MRPGQKRRRDRRARRRAYWEDRPERVAARRATFWNLYGRYTGVREKMTQNQKTMRRISSAIGVMGSPVAGAIAYAAMNVDKYIAPAQSALAGSEETIALLMIEELEADGTLSTREARNMAKATLKALEEAKNGATNGTVPPRLRLPPGPGPRSLPAAPGAPSTAGPATYWPWVAAAIGAIFILRGSK